MGLFDVIRGKPRQDASRIQHNDKPVGGAFQPEKPKSRRSVFSLFHEVRTRLIEKSANILAPRVNPQGPRGLEAKADAIIKAAAPLFNGMEAHSSVPLRPQMNERDFDAVKKNAPAFIQALLPLGQHGANLVAQKLDAYLSNESAGRGHRPPRLCMLSALSDALQQCEDRSNPVVAYLEGYVNDQFLTQFHTRRGGFEWDLPGETEWRKLGEAATDAIQHKASQAPHDADGLRTLQAIQVRAAEEVAKCSRNPRLAQGDIASA